MAITITSPTPNQQFSSGTNVIAEGNNGPVDTHSIVAVNFGHAMDDADGDAAAPPPPQEAWQLDLGDQLPIGKHKLTVSDSNKSASVIFEIVP